MNVHIIQTGVHGVNVVLHVVEVSKQGLEFAKELVVKDLLRNLAIAALENAPHLNTANGVLAVALAEEAIEPDQLCARIQEGTDVHNLPLIKNHVSSSVVLQTLNAIPQLVAMSKLVCKPMVVKDIVKNLTTLW